RGARLHRAAAGNQRLLRPLRRGVRRCRPPRPRRRRHAQPADQHLGRDHRDDGGEGVTVYLEPTPELGRRFVMRNITGPVTMLNLLRFRAVADYAANPELAPERPISGAEAFHRYIDHTL